MSESKQWRLLLGGLSRATDMPRLARQVVPEAADIDRLAQQALHVRVVVGVGQHEPNVRVWFEGDPSLDVPAPWRYHVEAPSDISPHALADALARAARGSAPLPSGIQSNWTLIVELHDRSGRRVARRTVEIPRGGGRGYLSPSGMRGIALGGLAGAAVGGPVGVVIGAVLGGAAGEALERTFPSALDMPTQQG